MRLIKYTILFTLVFTVCFLQAGTGNGAKLSEGNEITSTPQKTRESAQPLNNNGSRRQPKAPASEKDNTTVIVKPQSGARQIKGNSVSGQEDPRYVTIDFDNVDITLLIKFISELTGKNLGLDFFGRKN